MKIIKCLLSILLILSLSACAAVKNSIQEPNNSESTEINLESMTTNSENTKNNDHQILTSKTMLEHFPMLDEGSITDLPEVGLQDVVVKRKVDGFSLSAYILSDYRYGKSEPHDSYLAVEMDFERILFFDFENKSFDDFLYLNDVDGDGFDEIIIQQHVDMAGGAGQFSSYIFKVENDEIREIFNSSTCNLFDTGFVSEFLDGYKLKVSNTITGYSSTIDISNKYIDEYFDENGKGATGDFILCDSFFEFIPEDVDDDGIFEIICLQYTSLNSHPDYIGDAKSILKFNSYIQKFEVIESDFIPFVSEN